MRYAAAMAVLGLSACGGGGGGGGSEAAITSSAIFAKEQSVPSRDLQSAAVSGTSFTTSNSPWTLTYPLTNTGSVSKSGGSGTLDEDSSTIDFPSGVITVGNPSGTEYVMTIRESGSMGVLGEVTPASAVPSANSVSFSGQGRAIVNDGIANFDLTGKAKIDVNFGSGDVDIDLTGLSGPQLSASGNGTVSGHRISITDAALSGNQISGGLFSVGAGQYDTAPAGGTLSHAGNVFGPDGSEVGGAAGYDATGGGTAFTAAITYIGK